MRKPKSFLKISILCTAMCILYGCTQDRGIDIVVLQNYFPLAVDNAWRYEVFINGLVSLDNEPVDIVDCVTLSDGTSAYQFSFRNFDQAPLARKTDTSIEWYTDEADTICDCVWPYPLRATSLSDCRIALRSNIDYEYYQIVHEGSTYRIDFHINDQQDGSIWLENGIGISAMETWKMIDSTYGIYAQESLVLISHSVSNKPCPDM